MSFLSSHMRSRAVVWWIHLSFDDVAVVGAVWWQLTMLPVAQLKMSAAVVPEEVQSWTLHWIVAVDAVASVVA